MQMAAGGGCVKRGPLLRVFGVDIGAELQQQLHHALAVVDATLKAKSELVISIANYQYHNSSIYQ